MNLKKVITWLFDWIKGENACMLAGLFFTAMWFVVDWCMSTTFRPMSYPLLYLINFTAALILLAPWMLTRSRILGMAIIILTSIFYEANLIYCRTYFTAIPPEGYLMAGNMKDFTDSIFPNVRWTDLGFLVIICMTGLCSIKYNKFKKGKALLPYASLTLCFALISYIYVLFLGGFYKAYDSLTQNCKMYTSGVPMYTIAGHIVFKIMENEKLKNDSGEEHKAVEEWLQQHRDRYIPIQCESTRKNLVMVICESLESWPIGQSVAGKEITPFLNSVINDSSTLYAPNVLTQVCAGRSIDGQLIYTTGLLPTANSVYSMKYPDRNYPSLNKLLKKDRGSKSILMTTDKPITWNMLAVEKAFGYDTILCSDNWVKDEIINSKISDGSFFRQSLAALKKGKLWSENSPVMLTFITCSGHSPFKISSQFRDPDWDVSKSGLPHMLQDYIMATHYVDSQLKTVVDYIKCRPDADDTMIVILGDHEGLGKSRKDILKESEAARKYVNEGRYTPLIIINSPKGGRYDDVLGQIDIFPTIIDMLGVKDPDWRGVGISLLDTTRPKIAFSIIPPSMEGDPADTPADELEHIKDSHSISEKIIIHDLYRHN